MIDDIVNIFVNLLAKIDNCCESYSNDPEPFRNKFEINSNKFAL